MNTKDKVERAKDDGYCCSETIMKLVLEDLCIEDDRLIDAMGAFCGGMGAGQVCGALSALVSSMCVALGRVSVKKELRADIVEWFKCEHGALDCTTLIKGDAANKKTICPGIIESAYDHAHGLLVDRGLV